MDKETLRREMRKKRSSFDKALLERYSEQIYEKLLGLDDINKAKTILTYVSIGSEVDTHRLIKTLLSLGKKVCIPVVSGRDLSLSYMESFDDLVPSKLGILEPAHNKFKPCSEGEVDVVIVPGLAFDKKGFRIGYGGGYYDRLLPRLSAVKIGICYDFCIVDYVFPKHHDVSVDCVISN